MLSGGNSAHPLPTKLKLMNIADLTHTIRTLEAGKLIPLDVDIPLPANYIVFPDSQYTANPYDKATLIEQVEQAWKDLLHPDKPDSDADTYFTQILYGYGLSSSWRDETDIIAIKHLRDRLRHQVQRKNKARIDKIKATLDTQ